MAARQLPASAVREREGRDSRIVSTGGILDGNKKKTSAHTCRWWWAGVDGVELIDGLENIELAVDKLQI